MSKSWFQKPILIAEIGSVHDGSFGNACKLIEAAAACGADAVKFQTHIAEAETLENAPAPAYFKAEPRLAYFKRTSFSVEQWVRLSEVCRENRVEFLSSPFSLEAVDLLEDVGVGAYKIPSGEVSNLPLLEKVAETKKPVLLSSGMSDWTELDAAMKVLKGAGEICIMQCSSAYPCAPEKVGLNVLAEMKSRYGVVVGYSDHTLGLPAPFAAAALGAMVIEKHFTFSQLMYGSDAKHSMEPTEFKVLSQGLKDIWKMTASAVDKNDCSDYKEMKRIFEKSVVSARDLKSGARITLNDLAFKKPGDGIRAFDYKTVIGKVLNRDVPANTQIRKGDLS